MHHKIIISFYHSLQIQVITRITMSLSSSSIAFRGLGAAVAGLAVGSSVNMALVMLNVKLLYPMPDDVSFEDTEAFGAYIATLPLPAYIMVFGAHFGQTVAGGYTAARLMPDYGGELAHSIGILTMVGTVMNNLQIPVPRWTWIELFFHPLLAHWVATICSSAAKTDGKSN